MSSRGRTATWAHRIFSRRVNRCTRAVSAATEQPVGEPSLIITSSFALRFEARARDLLVRVERDEKSVRAGFRTTLETRLAQPGE